ncbi:MAG: CsbD family protein [Ilumatobacteraceae bacterium]
MSNSNIDDAKGRAKEAAGALTDNDDLKREGKADQAGAEVKKAVEKTADKAGDAVDAVKDKLSGN